MSLPVSVKWGKEKYSIDIDPSEEFEVLNAQLFALTSVPIDRQKILSKGKVLKTSEDLSKLKKGAKLMLMGTAEVLADAPSKPIVFEEDLTHEEKNEITGVPNKVGFENLGNTCYLNSSLQCLRNVPEFKESVVSFSQSNPSASTGELNSAITSQLGRLFTTLDKSGEPVAPHGFVDAFRRAYPQFAERGKHGGYAQQDAEECLSQLMSSLSNSLKGPDGNTIDQLFGITIQQELKCAESADEPPTLSTTSLRRLQCHIDINTNFLHDGLLAGLTEDIEKNSPSLGRNALYKRTNRISKLPKYLIVQFVRFFWRSDTNVKAKIMRKVTFPTLLDVEPYCEKELATSISKARKKKLDEEDKKMGLEPLSSSGKKEKESENEMDIEPESTSLSLSPPLNHEGFYELNGVVTHQGRYADGGHYIGWARQKGDDWLRFDDDVVTKVTTNDVKNLSGGGDWHMAYLCVYKLKTDDEEEEKK